MAKNEVRIIGGKWRGRKLRFHPAPGLRPTLGRVRETLFNWLAADVAGSRCLDLFAGTGALGFEAQSRGAELTVLVEQSPQSANVLRQSAEQLSDDGLQVTNREAFKFLASNRGKFDIVFVDPPYGKIALTRVLQNLTPHLSDEALVFWESAKPLETPEGYVDWKRSRAGGSHFGLVRYPASSC